MLKVLTWSAVVPCNGIQASSSDIGYISVESRHIFASSDDNFHRPLRSLVSPNATYFVFPISITSPKWRNSISRYYGGHRGSPARRWRPYPSFDFEAPPSWHWIGRQRSCLSSNSSRSFTGFPPCLCAYVSMRPGKAHRETSVNRSPQPKQWR